MNCPQCQQPMKNLGNLTGMIYLSYPEQWDEVMENAKELVKIEHTLKQIINVKGD